MSTHGPQHDEFPARSGNEHGGATYDEGFNSFPAAHTNAHGKLFDKFSKRPGVDRYGEQWDNFPWKDVPSLHGEHYDEGFDAPSFDADAHGQLHDVFRGSRVRYMYGGKDVEGIVLDTQRDFAIVESREGERHEVTLPQVLAYATDSGQGDGRKPTAQPATVDTSVVGSNSSPSASANGGGRSEGGSYDDSVVTHVKSLDEALEVVKSLDVPFDEAGFDADAQAFADEASDVNKTYVGVSHMSTKKLSEAHAKFSDHYHAARAAGNHDRAAFAAQVLASTHAELHARGIMAEHPDEGAHPITRGLQAGKQPLRAHVGKSVDSDETALQRDDDSPSQGANWCKTCQHYCRKVVQGTCPTCGGAVGVKKDWTAALDVLKGDDGIRDDAHSVAVTERQNTPRPKCATCGKPAKHKPVGGKNYCPPHMPKD